MRIGFVSDAHGNTLGLSACLSFLTKQKVDKIYFLGDAIGYFPDWSGVFSLLEEYSVECLQGNHDHMSVVGEVDYKKNLVYKITPKLIEENQANLSKIIACPSSKNIELNNKKILLVHGSPWDALNGYIYPDSDLKRFESIEADVVFMGHTHRPFVKNIYEKYLVNVGSCGMPRDVGNLASCAIYDADNGACDVYRIPFDTDKLISSYKDHIHQSVINCLKRRTENFFGTLVCS